MWGKTKRSKGETEIISNLFDRTYRTIKEKIAETDIYFVALSDEKDVGRALIFKYRFSKLGYRSEVEGYLNLRKAKHEIERCIDRDISRILDKCETEKRLKPSIPYIEGELVECYLTNKKLITGILKANPLIKEKMIESENEIYVIPSESILYIKIKKENKKWKQKQ